MARDVIIVANHVENFIRIGADLNSPGVEEEWRILFVHPLYVNFMHTLQALLPAKVYSTYLVDMADIINWTEPFIVSLG